MLCGILMLVPCDGTLGKDTTGVGVTRGFVWLWLLGSELMAILLLMGLAGLVAWDGSPDLVLAWSRWGWRPRRWGMDAGCARPGDLDVRGVKASC